VAAIALVAVDSAHGNTCELFEIGDDGSERMAVIRVPSNTDSDVKRNHETPKSGIPKRKKIEACPRLSCKIEYLITSNYSNVSTASEFFTGDDIAEPRFSASQPKPPIRSGAISTR
jgi:hypothetical protein